MKTWAYHPAGTVSEIVALPDDFVPGRDLYTPEFAAEMTDVTGMDPQPAFGWATADGGASFAAVIEPPPIAPARCSKLGLKRALCETGDKAVFKKPEWEAVKAALAANPDLQEDWDLAVEIRRADPLTQAVIAARRYTAAQADALMIRANELVA